MKFAGFALLLLLGLASAIAGYFALVALRKDRWRARHRPFVPFGPRGSGHSNYHRVDDLAQTR